MSGMLQLLRLINCMGEVQGRKKLQKIVHILQAQGFDFPQHFGYLHYGPFSGEVAAEADALVSDGLVLEEGEGQPMEAYVYTSTDAAHSLLQELGALVPPTWATLAADLNQRPANELEAISTILFLKANGFEGDRLKTRFFELKPVLKGLYANALKISDRLPMAR